MVVYVCELCGYEYDPRTGDPDNGIAENTDFEDIPADWVCPLCGYIHYGENPPEKCPLCSVPGSTFIKQE